MAGWSPRGDLGAIEMGDATLKGSKRHRVWRRFPVGVRGAQPTDCVVRDPGGYDLRENIGRREWPKADSTSGSDGDRGGQAKVSFSILIILGVAVDFIFLFLFLSLSLHALGYATVLSLIESFKSALSNNLLNPTNCRPGQPTSAGRKDGGLFSFAFWYRLFMSISLTSFTQSSFPSPLYALLGFRSMVYATVCFVAVLVFGQSHPFRFLANPNILIFQFLNIFCTIILSFIPQ